MNSSGVLLFTNDSGGAAASSGYVNEEFLDTVRPGSNNVGFSSTLARNPLAASFGDDLSTKWMAKTLFIKDMVLVEDRAMWISSRPTYKVVWNESLPGVEGYAFGSLQLDGTTERRRLLLSAIGDGFGVGGIVRRVVWLLQPVSGTGTCAQRVDGAGSVTHTFGGASIAAINGAKPAYMGFVHAATNETRDIHDYRITANQASTLAVYGAIVYFEVAGSGVDINPGTQYQNKAAVTVPVGSTLAFPNGITTLVGGKAGIYVTPTGGVGITTTQLPLISSNGIGTINTNLVNLNTGSGTSFLQGSVVFIPTASTHYLGQVLSVSGDVLTVAPTLPFGISNACSVLFQAGATYSISTTLHQEAFNYSADLAGQALNASFIAVGASGTVFQYNYFDPNQRFMVWGPSLAMNFGSSLASTLGNTLGFQFRGQSNYIQLDGRFSALEAEFIVGPSASLNYTLSIDGLATVAFNENVAGQGTIRRTIMTNGAWGNHTVRLSHGAGGTQTLLTRFIGYEPRFNGPTLGLLAEIPLFATYIQRSGLGATESALGNVQRKYIQQLYLANSGWTGSAADTGNVPGGNLAISNAVNDRINFSYFGTRCAVLGSTFASLQITIDGANGGSQLNTWLGSGLTLGFHSLVITNLGPATSLRVSAIDFLCPVGEVKSVANYDPLPEQAQFPRVYQGGLEPVGARTGDVWEQSLTPPVAYQRLYNSWQRVQPFIPAVYASAVTNTAQALSSTPVTLTFDSVIVDNRNALNAATGQFRVPEPGRYRVCGVVQTSTVSGVRQVNANLLLNSVAVRSSVTYNDTTAGSSFPRGTLDFVVTAGLSDLLEIQVSITDTGTIDPSAPARTIITFERLGP